MRTKMTVPRSICRKTHAVSLESAWLSIVTPTTYTVEGRFCKPKHYDSRFPVASILFLSSMSVPVSKSRITALQVTFCEAKNILPTMQ